MDQGRKNGDYIMNGFQNTNSGRGLLKKYYMGQSPKAQQSNESMLVKLLRKRRKRRARNAGMEIED